MSEAGKQLLCLQRMERSAWVEVVDGRFYAVVEIREP